MDINTVVIAIIAFGILIMFHELGHFILAKIVGIKVEEFAIGMGPVLWKFRRGETYYAIRVLPIGGFVRMLGEDEHSDDARAFNNQSVLERIAVIAAGPIMNFVLTAIILIIITAVIGVAVYSPVIDSVVPDSPAQKAGLMPGDKFLYMDGRKIQSANDARAVISSFVGKPLNAIVERNNKTVEVTIVPRYNPETQAAEIGVAFSGHLEKVPLWRAVEHSFAEIYSMTRMMLVGIGQLLIGRGLNQVMGPYGIVKIVGEAANQGLIDLMSLIAIISLNVGLINLVPFPALDGSRILFLIVEGIRGKPMDREKEGMIHFAGLVILMLLMIFITFQDIMR